MKAVQFPQIANFYTGSFHAARFTFGYLDVT